MHGNRAQNTSKSTPKSLKNFRERRGRGGAAPPRVHPSTLSKLQKLLPLLYPGRRRRELLIETSWLIPLVSINVNCYKLVFSIVLQNNSKKFQGWLDPLHFRVGWRAISTFRVDEVQAVQRRGAERKLGCRIACRAQSEHGSVDLRRVQVAFYVRNF